MRGPKIPKASSRLSTKKNMFVRLGLTKEGDPQVALLNFVIPQWRLPSGPECRAEWEKIDHHSVLLNGVLKVLNVHHSACLYETKLYLA